MSSDPASDNDSGDEVLLRLASLTVNKKGKEKKSNSNNKEKEKEKNVDNAIKKDNKNDHNNNNNNNNQNKKPQKEKDNHDNDNDVEESSSSSSSSPPKSKYTKPSKVVSSYDKWKDKQSLSTSSSTASYSSSRPSPSSTPLPSSSSSRPSVPHRVPIKVERAIATREADLSSGVAAALQFVAKKKNQKNKMKKLKKKMREEEEEESETESDEDEDEGEQGNNKSRDDANDGKDDFVLTENDQIDDIEVPPSFDSLSDEIQYYRDTHNIHIEWNTPNQSSASSSPSDIYSDSLYFPIRHFSDLNSQFDVPQRVLSSLSAFSSPRPVQSQGWPILLAGKDLIAIAETGQGKSLAFIVPAVLHVMAKTGKLNEGEVTSSTVAASPPSPPGSPFVLIVSPTRELASQIHSVLSSVTAPLSLSSLLLTGGPSMEAHQLLLQSPVDIIVCTPGRLMKLLEAKYLTLSRVSFLVLDEADKLLDLGFDNDIKRISSLVKAKHQSCLTSATWPTHVKETAKQLTREGNTIHLTVGSTEMASVNTITHVVEVIDRKGGRRERRLMELLSTQYIADKNHLILIFVLYKREASYLADYLNRKGFPAQSISGEKSHAQRQQAIIKFRNGDIPILVATDVAARGIDIPHITHVINFSLGLSVEQFVHRVGRTGRAGRRGIAHTFIVDYDYPHVPQLVEVLQRSGVKIGDDVREVEERAKRKEMKHKKEEKLVGDAVYMRRKTREEEEEEREGKRDKLKMKKDNSRESNQSNPNDDDEDEGDDDEEDDRRSRSSHQSNNNQSDDDDDDESVLSDDDESGGKVFHQAQKKHVTQVHRNNLDQGKGGGRGRGKGKGGKGKKN